MDFYDLNEDTVQVEIVPSLPPAPGCGKENKYAGRLVFCLNDNAYYFGMRNGWMGLGTGTTGGAGSAGDYGPVGETGGVGGNVSGGTGGTGIGSVEFTAGDDFSSGIVRKYHTYNTDAVVLFLYNIEMEEVPLESNWINQITSQFVEVELPQDILDTYGNTFYLYISPLSTHIETLKQNYKEIIENHYNYTLNEIIIIPYHTNEAELLVESQVIKNLCGLISPSFFIDYNGNFYTSDLIQSFDNYNDTTNYNLKLSKPSSGYLFIKCLESRKLSNIPEVYYPNVSPILLKREGYEWIVTHSYGHLPGLDINLTNPEDILKYLKIEVFDEEMNQIPIFFWNRKKVFNKFFYELNQDHPDLLLDIHKSNEYYPSTENYVTDYDDGKWNLRHFSLERYQEASREEKTWAFGASGGVGEVVGYKGKLRKDVTISDTNAISFEEVFLQWTNYAMNPYGMLDTVTDYNGTSYPIEDAWSFEDNKIITRVNTSAHIYCCSDYKVNIYNLQARMICVTPLENIDNIADDYSVFNDDDWISIVIARVSPEESSDGKEHTLSVVRSCFDRDSYTVPPFEMYGDQNKWNYDRREYMIVYDFNGEDMWIVMDGSSLLVPLTGAEFPEFPDGIGWKYFEEGCLVNVIRDDDVFKTYTSDFRDADNILAETELVLDLTVDERLLDFRQACNIGFGASSQRDATFTDVQVVETKILRGCREPRFIWENQLQKTAGYDYVSIDEDTIKITFFKGRGSFPVIADTTGYVRVTYTGPTHPIDIVSGERVDPAILEPVEPDDYICPAYYDPSYNILPTEQPLFEHIQSESAVAWVINHNLQRSDLTIKVFGLNGNGDYTRLDDIESSLLNLTIINPDMNTTVIFFGDADVSLDSIDYLEEKNLAKTISNLCGSKQAELGRAGKVEIWRNPFWNAPAVSLERQKQRCLDSKKIKTCSERKFVWHDQKKPSSLWNVNHGLDTTSIAVKAYDYDGIRIGPDEVKIIDENNVELGFLYYTNICAPARDHNYTWGSSGLDLQSLNDPYRKQIEMLFKSTSKCPQNVSLLYKNPELINIGDPIRDPLLGYDDPPGWVWQHGCPGQFVYTGATGRPGYIAYEGVDGTVPVLVIPDEPYWTGGVGIPAVILKPNLIEYYQDPNSDPITIPIKTDYGLSQEEKCNLTKGTIESTTLGDYNYNENPLCHYPYLVDDLPYIYWGVPADINRLSWIFDNFLPDGISKPLLPAPLERQTIPPVHNAVDMYDDHSDEAGWVYRPEEGYATDTPPGYGWGEYMSDGCPQAAMVFILGPEVLTNDNGERTIGVREWMKSFVEQYVNENDYVFMDIFEGMTPGVVDLLPFTENELNKLNYDNIQELLTATNEYNDPLFPDILELYNNRTTKDPTPFGYNYRLKIYWSILSLYYFRLQNPDIANLHVIVSGVDFNHEDYSFEDPDIVPDDYSSKLTRFAIAQYAKQMNVQVHFLKTGYTPQMNLNDLLEEGDFTLWVASESGGFYDQMSHQVDGSDYDRKYFEALITNLGRDIKNGIPAYTYSQTGGYGRPAYWEFTGGTGENAGDKPYYWDYRDSTSYTPIDSTSYYEHVYQYWAWTGPEITGEDTTSIIDGSIINQYIPTGDEHLLYRHVTGVGDRYSYINPFTYEEYYLGEFQVDREGLSKDHWIFPHRYVSGRVVLSSVELEPAPYHPTRVVYEQNNDEVPVWNIVHRWGKSRPIVRVYDESNRIVSNALYTISYWDDTLEIWWRDDSVHKGFAVLERPQSEIRSDLGYSGTGGTGGQGMQTGGKGWTGSTGGTGKTGKTGTRGCTGGSGKTGSIGGTGKPGETGGVGCQSETGNSGGTGGRGPSGGSGCKAPIHFTGSTGGTGGAHQKGGTGFSGSSGIPGGPGGPGGTGGTGPKGTGVTGGSGSSGGIGERGWSGCQGGTGATGAGSSDSGIEAGSNAYIRRYTLKISSVYIKNILRSYRTVGTQQIPNYSYTASPSSFDDHFQQAGLPGEVLEYVNNLDGTEVITPENNDTPYRLGVTAHDEGVTYLYEFGPGAYSGPIFLYEDETGFIFNYPGIAAVHNHKTIITDNYTDPRTQGILDNYNRITPKYQFNNYKQVTCTFQDYTTTSGNLKSGDIIPWSFSGYYNYDVYYTYDYKVGSQTHPITFKITVGTDGYIHGALFNDLTLLIEPDEDGDYPSFSRYNS